MNLVGFIKEVVSHGGGYYSLRGEKTDHHTTNVKTRQEFVDCEKDIQELLVKFIFDNIDELAIDHFLYVELTMGVLLTMRCVKR